MNEDADAPYIKITSEAFSDDRLSWFESLLLARIKSIGTYFESSETCAGFFQNRVTPTIVRRAKRRLEKLGLIVAIRNTGKGKVYVISSMGKGEDGTKMCHQDSIKTCHHESRRHKNMPCDGTKMCYVTAPKCSTYIKEDMKEKKNIGINTNIGRSDHEGESKMTEESESQPAEERQEFGNADINEAFKLWEDATGFDLSANKYERRAMFNLLRRKDVKAHGGFKALVTLVKDARRIDSRFAPKIAKPSELGGKFSKFERLIDWSKTREQTHAPSNTYHHEQDTSIIGTYYKPHPEVEAERYEEPRFMTAEEKEQERASCHEFCETFRAEVFGSIAASKKKHEEESRAWKQKRLNGSRF